MSRELLDEIIHAAIEVHQHLGGPGLLESVYESALCHELALRKIVWQRQIPIPVLYKGVAVRGPLFLDILVENQVVIEIKASEKDNPYFQAQLLTHLRLMKVRLGLLINFGKADLQNGIFRIAC